MPKRLKPKDEVYVDYDGRYYHARVTQRGKGRNSHRVQLFFARPDAEDESVWIEEDSPAIERHMPEGWKPITPRPEPESEPDEDHPHRYVDYGKCCWFGCAYITTKTKKKCVTCGDPFHDFHSPGAKHCQIHTVSRRGTGKRRKAIRQDR